MASGIINIPPNRSTLLLDSKYRKEGEGTGSFSAYLSSGITAKEIQYRTLNWTFPFFTHNTSSIEIRLIIENDVAPGPPTYVGYIRPWVIFKEFDGLTSGGGFNPPAAGTYAKEVEIALNDLRELDTNTVPLTAPPDNGAGAVTFFCEYNQSLGFVIYATAGGVGANFKILDCSWVKVGYNVHGFGVYDPDTSLMRPKKYNDANAYYSSYLSDATPTLTDAKFITIYCDQLTRERRLPSFRNEPVNILGDEQENFGNELGVLPILLEKVGRFTLSNVDADATTVSVRPGSEAQFLKIYMINNKQNLIKCGNGFGNFITDEMVPYDVRAVALDESSNYRSPVMMNYLLFGGSTDYGNTVTNTNARLENTGPDLSFVDTPGAAGDSDRQGYGSLSNSASTDTGAGWTKTSNSSLIVKVSNRVTTITITDKWEVLSAAGVPGGTTANMLLYYEVFAPGETQILVPQTVDPNFAVDAAQVGVQYDTTLTIDATTLNSFPIGTRLRLLQQWSIETSGLSSNTITMRNLGLQAGKQMTITSVGIVTNQYLDPADYTKYGKPDENVLCDDVCHQFDIIY